LYVRHCVKAKMFQNIILSSDLDKIFDHSLCYAVKVFTIGIQDIVEPGRERVRSKRYAINRIQDYTIAGKPEIRTFSHLDGGRFRKVCGSNGRIFDVHVKVFVPRISSCAVGEIDGGVVGVYSVPEVDDIIHLCAGTYRKRSGVGANENNRVRKIGI